jgi:hypothetical protein
MKVVWVRFVFTAKEWAVLKRFYKDWEIRHSLYDEGRCGLESCLDGVLEMEEKKEAKS